MQGLIGKNQQQQKGNEIFGKYSCHDNVPAASEMARKKRYICKYKKNEVSSLWI
jgi:hypothetical protein